MAKSNFHHDALETIAQMLQDFEIYKLDTNRPEQKVWLGDGTVASKPGDTLTITITAKTKNNATTN